MLYNIASLEPLVTQTEASSFRSSCQLINADDHLQYNKVNSLHQEKVYVKVLLTLLN